MTLPAHGGRQRRRTADASDGVCQQRPEADERDQREGGIDGDQMQAAGRSSLGLGRWHRTGKDQGGHGRYLGDAAGGRKRAPKKAKILRPRQRTEVVVLRNGPRAAVSSSALARQTSRPWGSPHLPENRSPAASVHAAFMASAGSPNIRSWRRPLTDRPLRISSRYQSASRVSPTRTAPARRSPASTSLR